MADFNKIADEIKAELEAIAEPEYRERLKGFFREEINPIGVRAKFIHEVAARQWLNIKAEPKDRIFELCEVLLKYRIAEMTSVALDLAWKIRRKYEPDDFELFQRWLDEYVDNWGACDNICCRNIGYMIFENRELIGALYNWTRSKNRWRKRASAVSLIYSNKRGENIDEAFEIANILMDDEDDLVRKGYGWMLKVVGEKRPKRVFDFVTASVARMPRVAFRYAIEKLPPEMKKRAMKIK
ncbi:DNA alkylation repair protein [bacterium]|nr:DNA alkylation repair protein [bacterium]